MSRLACARWSGRQGRDLQLPLHKRLHIIVLHGSRRLINPKASWSLDVAVLIQFDQGLLATLGYRGSVKAHSTDGGERGGWEARGTA